MISSWLAPEAPRERAAIARMLTGAFATVYVAVRFPYLTATHPPGDFAPVGICALLDAPLPTAAEWVVTVLAIVSGAAFTSGRHVRWTGPAFFLLLLWVLSWASSWGKILHSENLFLLHIGVFAIAGRIESSRIAGWTLRTASVVTVLTYFVAGVTKLRSGGATWLSGDALGNWLAWDALRKIELGSLHSPLAARIAQSPLLLRGLAAYTMIVEVGAPLALVSRRAGWAWVLLAWLFHAGILATMAIGFFYPLTGIAFLALLPVERVALLRRLATRGVDK